MICHFVTNKHPNIRTYRDAIAAKKKQTKAMNDMTMARDLDM